MLLNPTLKRSQRSLRRRLTAYVDVAVVGIPAVAMPSPLQFLIERIQIDVGQQRRQRPTLRCAFHAGFYQSTHHRSPPQVFANQVQHSFVPDHGCYPAHQNVVIDVVEELADVNIHHPVLPLLRILLCGSHGVVCAAPWPESIAVLTE